MIYFFTCAETPRQTVAQRRSYKTATTDGLGISLDFDLLLENAVRERSARSASRSHGRSRSGKHGKSRHAVSSSVAASTADSSREGESEAERIRRMRRDFLEKISGTATAKSAEQNVVPDFPESGLLSFSGAAGGNIGSSKSPNLVSALKLDKSTVKKKTSRSHLSNSGKGSSHSRMGRASSDPHTAVIDNTLRQLQATNEVLSASVQDMCTNLNKTGDSAQSASSTHLKAASAGCSPAKGSPAARPKVRTDPSLSPKLNNLEPSSLNVFTKVQRKSLSVQADSCEEIQYGGYHLLRETQPPHSQEGLRG